MDNTHITKLALFIKNAKEEIPQDGLEAVQHYFDHDEYEMSFEGLVIELMTANTYPEQFVFREWRELALVFGLDNDPVFDGDFWRKFNLWGMKKVA